MDARTKIASRLRPHSASCALHLSTVYGSHASSGHSFFPSRSADDSNHFFYQYAGGDCLGAGASLKVSIASISPMDLNQAQCISGCRWELKLKPVY